MTPGAPARYPVRMRLSKFGRALGWVLMVAGCASEGELVVDLVTDLRPGVEIVSAVA